MQRGHKVRRKHWSGYWFMKENELFIHTKEGKELNIRETEDMPYTLSNISCDDWEVVIENDKVVIDTIPKVPYPCYPSIIYIEKDSNQRFIPPYQVTC